MIHQQQMSQIAAVFFVFCKLTQDETEENGMMGNAAI